MTLPLALLISIVWVEVADEVKDMLPERMEELHTDPVLVEHSGEEAGYILRVSRLYYDIQGQYLEYKWSNRSANPEYFREEADQLPEVDLPAFVPEQLNHIPVSYSEEDEVIIYSFYFTNMKVVFSLTAASDDEEIRENLIRRGFGKLETEKLLEWEGFN